MVEVDLMRKMRAAGLSLTAASTPQEREVVLEKAIKIIIPPKSRSDTTCFRRVCSWLTKQVENNNADEHAIYRRVLDFALEASSKEARTPAAVFLYLMKKELNYDPKRAAAGC